MYLTGKLVVSSCLFMAVILLMLIVSIQTSNAQSSQNLPTLFPHDSKPFNATMGKWLERYWIWVASIPKDIHPRGDTTGQHCGTNQNGPVWFLDPPVEQPLIKSFYCEIPEGKAIFVPLLVGECDATVLEDPTDSNISACSKEGNDQGNIKFSIDGKTLLEIKKTSQSQEHYSLYRTTSDFFNISFIDNNIFDASTGTYRAQADGYIAIVQPLALGDHEMFIQNNVMKIQPDAKALMHLLQVSFHIKVIKTQNSTS
jgi:hypothetical protein